MAWDTPRVDGDIHYAADHNEEINQIKLRAPTDSPEFTGTPVYPLLYFGPTPTYYTLQDYIDTTTSSGRIEGGEIEATVPADGTFKITAMKGFIKNENSEIGETLWFEMDEVTGIEPDDGKINYVYCAWNGGTPAYFTTDTRTPASIPWTWAFNIGRVFREGTEVETLTSGINLYNRARRQHERWIDTYGGLSYANGIVVSVPAGASPNWTAGVLYAGSNRIDISAVNCAAAGRFESYYYNPTSGLWVETANQQIIDYTKYNNVVSGTGLASLTVNKYGIHWIYCCPEGNMYILYGKGDYTLAQAQAATVATPIPNYLSQWAKLAAKAIIRQDGTVHSVVSAWATQFPVQNAGNHNDLGNLTYASAGHTGFAPEASPSLTGTPLAPTAAVDTDTTQIATTAFVNDQIEQGTKPTMVIASDVPAKGGVPNPGFDNAPPFTAVQTSGGWMDGTAAGSSTNDAYGWYFYRSTTAVSARFDPMVTHSGGYSIKISTTDTSGKCYVTHYNPGTPTLADYAKYLIRIKPSTRYRLHSWIKTNNVATNSAYINTIQYDSAGVAGSNSNGTQYTGTYDWFEYVYAFTSDSDAYYLRIAPALYATGATSDAWFDDVWLEEIVSDTTFTGTVPTPVKPIISGVTTLDSIDQSIDLGWTYANHYTCPNAVNEGATHRQTFTPTKGKICKISVNLLNGPDTMYLILHDSSNVILGSGTLENPGVGVITFDFSSLWSSGALHFHVLSASGGLQIATNTHEDLEDASFIQYCAKATCSPRIVCNGNVINIPTNEDGLLHGAIIDFDCGTYLYNGPTSVADLEKLTDIYAISPGGRTDYSSYPIMIHGHVAFTSLGLVDITSSTGATERYITYKVNTLLPIKHLSMKIKMYSNQANDKLFQISPDNSNWTTLWTLNGAGIGRTSQVIDTDVVNGLSTFYIRAFKDAANNDYNIIGIHYIYANLDTSSVPNFIMYPLGVPNQFTESVLLPATADRIYLRYNKYTNGNNVSVPHLEFCATATPVGWVPIPIENIGEASPAVKIIAAETNTCTVGTGSDEGGNFILNNGEYVTITTPATSIKVTYQVGTGTTAFSHITMNRFNISSNGCNTVSTLKATSYCLNLYVGMRKEGTQHVLKDALAAINNTPNYAYFRRDCTLSLTGYAVNQSVTDSYLRIAAGTQGQYPFPPAIQLNGPNKAANAGLIILQVPNAAKSAVVNALTISGVVDIPVVTMGTFNIYDGTNTSIIARTIDTGYLDVRAGVNASAACLRLSGKDDATSGRHGGFALYVTDAAETSVKAIMYADGATDTPVLNMNTFRIGNIGAPTTAGDALIHQAWAAWSPTVVWAGATPASITTVARWTQIGKTVFFSIYINSTDSNACTGVTITLPSTPSNTGGYPFVVARQMSNNATYNTVPFYISQTGAETRLITNQFVTCTDGQRVQIGMEGFYEVA